MILASGGIRCALSGGVAFGAASRWSSDFNSLWSVSESYYGTIQYADVNGDGKADVCGRGYDGIYCALSSGSAFAAATRWSAVFSDANGWDDDPSYYKTIQLVDLNGDGKADVCGRGMSGIYCALSSGTSFGSVTLWSAQYSNANNWSADASYWTTIQYADLDGDRRVDVCGRGAAGLVCALNTGAAFGGASVWATQYSDAAGWRAPEYYTTLRLADINGDRRVDICGRGSAGFYCGRSTGSSFAGTSDLHAPEFSNANGWSAVQFYRSLWVVDVNGDGKADICGRGYSAIHCALSSSSSTTTLFGRSDAWVDNFGDNAGWGDSPSYWATVHPARVAARSEVRFCGRGYSGINCSR